MNQNLATDFRVRFQQLLLEKPRFNLKHVQVENSDYADTILRSKNCYYTFGAFYCEDVYYSRYSRKCVDCSGVTLCLRCEGCIECTDCADCYEVAFCHTCRNCNDCVYCEECYGCASCFGCVGLHQKRYCLFNEQLTESAYRSRVAAFDLSSSAGREQVLGQVEACKRRTPIPALSWFRTESSSGNFLSECVDCSYCFDAMLLEDCCYVIEANANKSGCDITVCFETELCYSCVLSPLNYACNFMFQAESSSHCEFCAYSKNLKNCFGCVYLADKEFYILNEPVPAAEYPRRVNEIREALIQTGDYNIKLFLASEYDRNRLRTETDPVITV